MAHKFLGSTATWLRRARILYALPLIAICLLTAAAFAILDIFSLLVPPAPTAAVKSTPFPAEPEHYFIEMHSSRGDWSKRFVSGDCQRLESYDQDGKLDHVTIYRQDKGVMWSEVLGEKRFTERPLDVAVGEEMDSLVIWSEDGQAVIDGYTCRRFVGNYVAPSDESGFGFNLGPGKAHEESFIDAANGLPVRFATYDVLGRERLVNKRVAFDLNPPDPKLFEIPDGYAVEKIE